MHMEGEDIDTATVNLVFWKINFFLVDNSRLNNSYWTENPILTTQHPKNFYNSYIMISVML